MSARMPKKMRPHALSGAIVHCPVCQAEFEKKRRWQRFCEPKCRKQAWLLSKRTGIYTDIRQGIDDIRQRLDRIEKALNMKGEA